MYVGAVSHMPRKFSAITLRDPIDGFHMLHGLGAASAPPMFSPDQIAQLGPSFGWISKQLPDPRYTYGIVYRSGNYGAITPIGSGWSIPASSYGYGNYGARVPPSIPFLGLGVTAVNPYQLTAPLGASSVALPKQPMIDVVQAPAWYVNAAPYITDTSYAHTVIMKKARLPSGDIGYIVPPWWLVGGGQQVLTPDVAKAAGGIALSDGATIAINGAHADPRGYLFAYDPTPNIPIGLTSGTYKPGQNVGLENMQGLIRAAGFVAAVVALPIAGAALGVQGASAAAAEGAATSAATAGATAGASAGLTTAGTAIATAPVAAGVSAGLPAALIVAPVAISAPVAASNLFQVAPGAQAASSGAPVVTSAAPASSGILGTGVTASEVQKVVGVAKTLYATAQKYMQSAKALNEAGNVNQANQNALLAQQYQQQGDDLMSTLNRPIIGGIPLWLLAVLGIGAKLLFF
jgi:hypothetical protein